MDSCHGLVVAPTDEHLKPRRARAGTVLWSSLLRRRMRGRRRTGLRGSWRRRAARRAERGTFSRRRWCLNGISASPPPALVPGRIGQSATCPCANVLPFVLLATPAFDSRAISPNVNPPSTAPQPDSRMSAPRRTLRFETRAAGRGLSWPCVVMQLGPGRAGLDRN